MGEDASEALRQIEEAARASRPDPDHPPYRGSALAFLEERRAGRATAPGRVAVAVDQDIVEAFRALAEDDAHQALMNRALREWLTTRELRHIVREELLRAFQERDEAGGKTPP